MTTAIKYIFYLTIIFVATSFTDKDLNEYGKWLKFYKLKDADFKQVGNEKEEKLDWKSYDLTVEYRKIYDTLYFYAPNSAYFLDLDSYSVELNKDSNGELTWFGGDPESKIQLVKTKDFSASTLLFFDINGFAETAIWRNNYLFEIFGFKINDNKFVPTIWKYDLNKRTCTEFANRKTFNIRPKSYLIEVRLKKIKQK